MKSILVIWSGLLAFTAFVVFPTIGKTEETNIVYINVQINQPNVEDCYDDGTLIPDLHETDWLNLFPNPNEGKFNLDITELKAGERIAIFVFNVQGERVYYTTKESPDEKLRLEFNLTHLQKGVYFMQIQADKRIGIKQLIIV